jgi:hypothetical protein
MGGVVSDIFFPKAVMSRRGSSGVLGREFQGFASRTDEATKGAKRGSNSAPINTSVIDRQAQAKEGIIGKNHRKGEQIEG